MGRWSRLKQLLGWGRTRGASQDGIPNSCLTTTMTKRNFHFEEVVPINGSVWGLLPKRVRTSWYHATSGNDTENPVAIDRGFPLEDILPMPPEDGKVPFFRQRTVSSLISECKRIMDLPVGTSWNPHFEAKIIAAVLLQFSGTSTAEASDTLLEVIEECKDVSGHQRNWPEWSQRKNEFQKMAIVLQQTFTSSSSGFHKEPLPAKLMPKEKRTTTAEICTRAFGRILQGSPRDLEVADRLLRKAISESPKFYPLHVLLGFSKRQLSSAITPITFNQQLGIVQEETDAFEEAVNQSLQTDPLTIIEAARANIRLCKLSEDHSASEQFQNAIERLRTISKDLPPYLLLRALLAWNEVEDLPDEGLQEERRFRISDAVHLVPHSPSRYLLIGMLQEEDSNQAEALQEFRKGLELDPENPQLRAHVLRLETFVNPDWRNKEFLPHCTDLLTRTRLNNVILITAFCWRAMYHWSIKNNRSAAMDDLIMALSIPGAPACAHFEEYLGQISPTEERDKQVILSAIALLCPTWTLSVDETRNLQNIVGIRAEDQQDYAKFLMTLRRLRTIKFVLEEAKKCRDRSYVAFIRKFYSFVGGKHYYPLLHDRVPSRNMASARAGLLRRLRNLRDVDKAHPGIFSFLASKQPAANPERYGFLLEVDPLVNRDKHDTELKLKHDELERFFGLAHKSAALSEEITKVFYNYIHLGPSSLHPSTAEATEWGGGTLRKRSSARGGSSESEEEEEDEVTSEENQARRKRAKKKVKRRRKSRRRQGGWEREHNAEKQKTTRPPIEESSSEIEDDDSAVFLV
ncbi:unnamed protein product [Cyprideis torosa]|uniref:Uncharacterized protein n=1 Tax=Cyprideis torosa TaxID=163714 RepID=A0A7R8WJ65_9CRUS|nr:unnamed protein product [Cyprideis torosa]CAG0895283.1 unnamed protein product [Cyprideis torosa]